MGSHERTKASPAERRKILAVLRGAYGCGEQPVREAEKFKEIKIKDIPWQRFAGYTNRENLRDFLVRGDKNRWGRSDMED